jgi:cyclopropane fatty-acyl-phospholipid synthase-like methyltransferase
MKDKADRTTFFYSRHPISADIILAKLQAARGHLDGVRPEELWPHDQDHYGALAANDALAEVAGIGPDMRVADFCAGLGGPARYLAHRHGAEVIGIELTPARVEGAARLTTLVGLQDRVRVLHGDVMAPPLKDSSVDAVVSQEAFLHVPDKARALAAARRVLKPEGRLTFTDWIAHRPLSSDDAALMWEGMAVQKLGDIPAYRALVESAGFRVDTVADLSAEWKVTLRERLTMYQRLRGEAERAGTPQGHDAFHRSYLRFVALIEEGVLGGVRIGAKRL